MDPPEGEYRVEGRNPEGEDYEGTVTIAEDGDGYRLSWKVGDSAYEGTGNFADNLLTVDWGGTTPIVSTRLPTTAA